MIKELDNLTEINLKILFDSSRKEIENVDFKDDKNECLMDKYDGVSVNRLIQYMEEHDLIETFEDTSRITTKGNKIANNGGWVKYKNDLLLNKKIELKRSKEKELKASKLLDLEVRLAKSNIKANKLNTKIAKRNKRETVINIFIGLLNVGLLAWQLLKAE